MAKQEKPRRDATTALTSTSSSRWRAGSPRSSPTHGLTELIVDTKETTLTLRRGGVGRDAPMPMHDADADADAACRACRARAGALAPRRRRAAPPRSTTRRTS